MRGEIEPLGPDIRGRAEKPNLVVAPMGLVSLIVTHGLTLLCGGGGLAWGPPPS